MVANARPLVALAIAGAMFLGGSEICFAQNAFGEHPPIPGAAPPSAAGPGWGPEQDAGPAPADTAPPELPVLYVTSVEVLRASGDPELDIVRVTGFASSEGWSAPQLVPTYAGKPFDGILDLELIATPPDQAEAADGFVPISAIFPIAPGQGLAGVRVRGSENALTVGQIPGANQVRISIDDCSHCVGQKFAFEGNAAQPQQGVVREEDLPKLLRIIKANDGIRGIDHDPNRLSLTLGEDNTILEAFWE